MKYKLTTMSVIICCLGLFNVSPNSAQELRIQQPVVQQFSAGTTVSVPDRGRALLGGISSGRTQSKRFGPFRRGSTYGQEFRSSTSTVGVYIHDFEAMDQFLLNSAPTAAKNARRSHYLNQIYQKQPRSSQQAGVNERARSLNALELQKSKAQRFFKLGQAAEKKHATSNVAKLHYRMAVKYGSKKAKARLRTLNTHEQKISAK